MQKFTLEVSAKGKSEGDKRVAVGAIEIFYPLLSELGLNVEPTGADESGFPTYATEELQFAFDSVFAATKAIVRNRLESGTATLKAGKTIPTTVTELLEAPEGNKGEALKLYREFIQAVTAYAAKIGKSAKAQATLASWLSSKKTLAVISAENKKKALQYITDAVAEMSVADQAKFENVAMSLADVAEAAEGDDEL
jgi:hypothetical protein